jgi:hypothetical protein
MPTTATDRAEPAPILDRSAFVLIVADGFDGPDLRGDV